ncbi:hypothetical protein HPP92_004336 [Vanilla planifolia]|uniref:Uncharacterized protein n=1 Tax=Vanilla planifolia TaxID=51239 RepID=A0A835VC72_VANPL|nr:hypothetical protein HPP92_004336 [Vanilla planifolia]
MPIGLATQLNRRSDDRGMGLSGSVFLAGTAATAVAGREALRFEGLLERIEDVVDEMSVGRGVPSGPVTLVTAEAPASKLWRMTLPPEVERLRGLFLPGSSFRADEARAFVGEEVGEDLSLLRREGSRQGEDGRRKGSEEVPGGGGGKRGVDPFALSVVKLRHLSLLPKRG